MDIEVAGLLLVAFLPGIVLVIAGAVSATRNYGVTFLWCLRFAPLREKLKAMLHEMHPASPCEPAYEDRDEPGILLAADEKGERECG